MTELLPAEDLANSPGFVSPHCRCSVTDGVCFITVGGQLMGAYEVEDKTAQRSLWVQVYRAGHATQVQIARYLKIGLRTFHGWVSRYRQEGMAGLSDRPKSGRRAMSSRCGWCIWTATWRSIAGSIPLGRCMWPVAAGWSKGPRARG